MKHKPCRTAVGLSRPSTSFGTKQEDVDGRDKPGHDGGIGILAAPIFILHCGKKLAHSELPGNF